MITGLGLLGNNRIRRFKPHLKGQLQGPTAMLPAFAALLTRGERTLRDALRAQDNLSKLLNALSAIAAPSAGTFKICAHFW